MVVELVIFMFVGGCKECQKNRFLNAAMWYMKKEIKKLGRSKMFQPFKKPFLGLNANQFTTTIFY